MAMGTRTSDQAPLWIAASELPKSPGHPFYVRLSAVLDAHDFDRFVEDLCSGFYAPVMGRPSLPPGRYFRLLLIGYFEGLDSERGLAWRATGSLAVRVSCGWRWTRPRRGRQLIIIEAEAATVRHIFTRYCELGSVRLLKDELDRSGVLSKVRVCQDGVESGGQSFLRGALYTLL